MCKIEPLLVWGRHIELDWRILAGWVVCGEGFWRVNRTY